MTIPHVARSFLSLSLSVFLGLALSFVGDLLLHPDDVDRLQKVQQRSMDSVEAFTPSEFGSRFIAAMSSDPDVAAAQKERESRELNRKGREASQQIPESAKRFEATNPKPRDRAAGTNDQRPSESLQTQESDQEAVRRLMHWKPGIQHWASSANGPAIVFRPLIALVDVLWNTFPSFLSTGFVLTAAELVIGGMFVILYVRPRIPNIWGPLTLAVVVLLTVAAGTLVAEICWLAAHAGLYVLGGVLDLAESISVWIAMGGLAGFITVKYAEVGAHHKAHILAAKALHLD
jgi:hypothetical protein